MLDDLGNGVGLFRRLSGWWKSHSILEPISVAPGPGVTGVLEHGEKGVPVSNRYPPHGENRGGRFCTPGMVQVASPNHKIAMLLKSHALDATLCKAFGVRELKSKPTLLAYQNGYGAPCTWGLRRATLIFLRVRLPLHAKASGLHFLRHAAQAGYRLVETDKPILVGTQPWNVAGLNLHASTLCFTSPACKATNGLVGSVESGSTPASHLVPWLYPALSSAQSLFHGGKDCP